MDATGSKEFSDYSSEPDKTATFSADESESVTHFSSLAQVNNYLSSPEDFRHLSNVSLSGRQIGLYEPEELFTGELYPELQPFTPSASSGTFPEARLNTISTQTEDSAPDHAEKLMEQLQHISQTLTDLQQEESSNTKDLRRVRKERNKLRHRVEELSTSERAATLPLAASPLRAYEQKIASYKERLKVRKTSLASLKEQLTISESSLDDVTKAFKDRERTLEACQKELRELKLKTDLEKNDQASLIKKLAENLRQESGGHSKTAPKISTLGRLIRNALKYKKQAEENIEKLSDISFRLDERNREAIGLQKELDRLKVKLVTMTDTSDHIAALTREKESREELQRSLDILKEEHKEQLELLTEEFDRTKTLLVKKESQIQQVTDTIKSATSVLTHQLELINEQTHKISTLTNSLKEAEEALIEHKETSDIFLDFFQTQHTDDEGSLNALIAEKAQWEDKQKQLESQLNEQVILADKRQEYIVKLTSQNDVQSQMIIEATDSLTKNESHLTELKKEGSKKNKEIQQSNQIIASLKTDLESVKTGLKEKDAIIEKLDTDLKKTLDKEAEHLQKIMDSELILREDIDAKARLIQDKDREIEVIKLSMEKLESESADLHLALEEKKELNETNKRLKTDLLKAQEDMELQHTQLITYQQKLAEKSDALITTRQEKCDAEVIFNSQLEISRNHQTLLNEELETERMISHRLKTMMVRMKSALCHQQGGTDIDEMEDDSVDTLESFAVMMVEFCHSHPELPTLVTDIQQPKSPNPFAGRSLEEGDHYDSTGGELNDPAEFLVDSGNNPVAVHGRQPLFAPSLFPNSDDPDFEPGIENLSDSEDDSFFDDELPARRRAVLTSPSSRSASLQPMSGASQSQHAPVTATITATITATAREELLSHDYPGWPVKPCLLNRAEYSSPEEVYGQPTEQDEQLTQFINSARGTGLLKSPEEISRKLNEHQIAVPEWHELKQVSTWTPALTRYALFRLGVCDEPVLEIEDFNILKPDCWAYCYAIGQHLKGWDQKSLRGMPRLYNNNGISPPECDDVFHPDCDKEWKFVHFLFLAWYFKKADYTISNLKLTMNILKPSSLVYREMVSEYILKSLNLYPITDKTIEIDQETEQKIKVRASSMNSNKVKELLPLPAAVIDQDGKEFRSCITSSTGKWTKEAIKKVIAEAQGHFPCTNPHSKRRLFDDFWDSAQRKDLTAYKRHLNTLIESYGQSTDAFRNLKIDLKNRRDKVEKHTKLFPIYGTTIADKPATAAHLLLSFVYFYGFESLDPNLFFRQTSGMLALIKPNATDEKLKTLVNQLLTLKLYFCGNESTLASLKKLEYFRESAKNWKLADLKRMRETLPAIQCANNVVVTPEEESTPLPLRTQVKNRPRKRRVDSSQETRSKHLV
ncbi:coiled-coil domain-containing protein [Endozoicomonas numazuensis]|uniref:Uncharacterized protein n=1 Tax=Endozoicomonas numazuensis TaxID=1137799 RepID=A0A081NF22_9GAMM|nr:hypothetical protein [Endozoicomonas numazuensis]KEQ17045.1 hypothetical protein GZ78_14170 [Endozoicomonas numazuensis]